MVKKMICAAAALVALSACGDEDKDKNNQVVVIIDDMAADQAIEADMAEDMAPDQSQPADMPKDMQFVGDMEDDIPQFGDVDLPDVDDGCDEAAVVRREWPLHAKKTTGAVTITADAGVFTVVLDASAGGFNQSRNNPFVYLDLDNGGAKVDITDIESLTNTDWELAFKRTAIRTNSEHSGPGAVKTSKEFETTFEAVTTAPDLTDPTAWKTDTTVDEMCRVLTDPIGTPQTAFNYLNLFNASGSRSWYQYVDGQVAPTPGDIYLVKSATSNTIYKLEIQSWRAGTYTIRWSALH